MEHKGSLTSESVLIESTLTFRPHKLANKCAQVVEIKQINTSWKIQNHDEKFYFKFQYINKNIVGEAKYDLQLKNGKNIILDSPFKLIDASWIPLFDLNSCQTIRNSNLELIITIRPNRATIMPIPTLVRGNEKILNEAAFSDFTFIVNGKEFKVHRNILGFVSPVMMKLFTTDMAEKRLQTCNVTEISAEIFEYMLHYIYCGKLPENIELVAMNLYEAAHYYQIEPLMEICIYNMSDRLHAGNAVTLYEWSVCFDIADLKAKSWDLVKRCVLKITFKLKEEPLSVSKIHELLEIRLKEKELLDSVKA